MKILIIAIAANVVALNIFTAISHTRRGSQQRLMMSELNLLMEEKFVAEDKVYTKRFSRMGRRFDLEKPCQSGLLNWKRDQQSTCVSCGDTQPIDTSGTELDVAGLLQCRCIPIRSRRLACLFESTLPYPSSTSLDVWRRMWFRPVQCADK